MPILKSIPNIPFCKFLTSKCGSYEKPPIIKQLRRRSNLCGLGKEEVVPLPIKVITTVACKPACQQRQGFDHRFILSLCRGQKPFQAKLEIDSFSYDP